MRGNRVFLSAALILLGWGAALFLRFILPESLGSAECKYRFNSKCYESGPIIIPSACHAQGGQEYLEKYKVATWKYKVCEFLAEEAIGRSFQNGRSDDLITCARFASKLCCFQTFVEANRRCISSNKEFAMLKKYTDIGLKTVRRECAEPQKLSVLFKPGTADCIFKTTPIVAAVCFGEFLGYMEEGVELDNVDYSKVFFPYAQRFYEIIIGHNDRLCGVLTKKLNCALAWFRDCGDPVFSYLAEVVPKIVNSETQCTYDSSAVPSQPGDVWDSSLQRYDSPDGTEIEPVKFVITKPKCDCW